jgi:hypothetical protein
MKFVLNRFEYSVHSAASKADKHTYISLYMDLVASATCTVATGPVMLLLAAVLGCCVAAVDVLQSPRSTPGNPKW